MLAFSTVALGVVTVVVTIFDNVRNSRQRREDKNEREKERDDDAADRQRESLAQEELQTTAAMRELYQIVTVFKNRTGKLAMTSTPNPNSLMQGLDVLLARALSDNIARALPSTTDIGYVYRALFTAFDALAEAPHRQQNERGQVTKAGDAAAAADAILQHCLESLTAELKARGAEWAPSMGTRAGNQTPE